VSAWVLLHASTLRWLGVHFAGSLLHAGLLAVAVVLLTRGLWPRVTLERVLAALATPPRPAAIPLALVATAALGFMAVERRLDVSILSATLFGLGSYGLAGLYLDRDRFHRALPAALLLVALLPFGDQADTYLGFTARVWTARVVAGVLAALGRGALSVETILVLENGAAHVDVPCSGVRSLWTGLLFFLAATCVLGRRPGARWALVGIAHAGLLLGENLLRVGAVVLLAAGMGLREVAEVLHAPIGVLGFALACAMTLGALRRWVPGEEGKRQKAKGKSEKSEPESEPERARISIRPLPFAFCLLPFALSALLLVLAALHTRRPAAASPPPPPRLELPAAIETSPLPLTVAEVDLFRRWGGAADKRRFRAGDREGALLAVFSRSWRAHHAPEVCLAGSGVRVEALRDLAWGGGASVRVASADGGRRTAVYWFQSPSRTTSDLASRIWDEIAGRERRWVQISLLVDAPLAIDSPEGRALVDAIRGAAARALAEENP
jgi:exosortase O